MVRPAGLPGAITHAVFPTSKHAPRAATCCDAYLPLSGAFEGAEYARRLEFAAVQLFTPNCQKRPTTKPRASAGKISKTIFTAKLIGLSHFGATLAPEGYSILLTAAINLVGRTKGSKWRALNRPVGNARRGKID